MGVFVLPLLCDFLYLALLTKTQTMKKLLVLIVALFTVTILFAQAPQSINYQCVVRDNLGALLTSHAVRIKFVVHLGSATGTTAYAETNSAITNQFGLVSLAIGQGTAIAGTFAGISWSSGLYFLETQIDVSGGTNYQSMGTQQLISVPYALYAEKANEHQTLSLSGNQLSISSGNSVTLPSGSGSSATFQQTLQQGTNYAFVNATSEPGVDSFLAVFGYFPSNVNNTAIAPVVHKDALTGTYEITGGGGYMGQCGGSNGVYITSATTHRGGIYFTYTNGCAGHTLATPTGNVTYDVQPTGSNGIFFSDGTYLYLNNNTNWLQYSASGNALTLVGPKSFSTTPTNISSIMCDGTNIFVLAFATTYTLYKYDLNWNLVSTKAVYGLPTGLVNIDATKLYLVSPVLVTPSSNVQMGGFTMTPISKP